LENPSLWMSSRVSAQARAALQFYNTTTPYDKRLLLNGDGTTTIVNNGAGANTLAGPVTLNGNCLFNAGGTSLTLGGPVGGSGSLTKNGTLAVKVKETTAAAPQINKPTLSGSNLILTGSGGTPNTTYFMLTSTNVALPKTNWLPSA
jgi:hypothetical protein